MHSGTLRHGATGAVVAALLTIAGLLLSGCDTADETLTGTLTVDGGAPAARVDVRVYRATAETLVASTVTDGTGHFSFTADDLHEGDYRVAFGQTGTATWWHDATDWAGAATVHATVGAAPELTQQLASGSVAGTVTTDPGGNAGHGATVAVQIGDTDAEGRTVATAVADGSGAFSVSGLPAGRYRLLASGAGLATRFVSADPHGTTALGDATVVEITPGTTRPGNDITLAPEAVLSGKVVDAHGELEGIVAVAFDASTGGVRATTSTDHYGDFHLRSLSATGTRIGFIDPTGGHASKMIGAPAGAVDPHRGTVFVPTEGADQVIERTTLPGAGCTAARDAAAADLTGADLDGLDLSACDLSGADLTGASLRGADLTDADLSYAVLTSADLTDADLTDARSISAVLLHTDLTRADLTRTGAFGANLYGAVLEGAVLTDTGLTGARSGRLVGTPATLPPSWRLTVGYLVGPGVDLTGADLGGADLSRVDLGGAVITGASFGGVDFERVRSGGLIGVPHVLPPNWWLRNGYLVGPWADLTGANLTNTSLQYMDLTGVLLQGAKLTDTNLGGANLTDANLDDATLRHANLYAANLTNTFLFGADLSDADLRRAVLTETNVNHVEMATTHLDPAEVYGPVIGAPDSLPEGWSIDGSRRIVHD